eukprot:985291-Alexandrium_andersonii.AAC.1
MQLAKRDGENLKEGAREGGARQDVKHASTGELLGTPFGGTRVEASAERPSQPRMVPVVLRGG